MRNASAKRRVYNNCLQMTIAPEPKTSSVILEILKILIQNQALGVNFNIKPVGEKTRGIASLHGTTDPNGMDDLMVGFYCSVNREIHLNHEKVNAIRPYNNGII